MNRPVLAVTLGDPVGIGPEITARTLAEVAGEDGHHGIAVGDAGALRRGAAAAGLDVDVRVVNDFSVAPAGPGTIDVYDIGVLGDAAPEWGTVDPRAGKAAVVAIEVATKAAMDQQVAGIVTGPINKEAIWASGSTHLGHTEMLGELTGVTRQDTMFVVRDPAADGHHLRIFFTTRHVALRKALDQLTRDRVGASIREALTALTVFGTEKPRLAVAAVNPHGGENGAFGDEEIVHIGPACEDARAEGLDVTGPVPADSVFHQGLSGRFDGVLSHYHDQGHIAAKTFDFNGTISVTVGLPILRTSVDHGTAFDIAGSGKADHGTMLSAYRAGVDYSPYVPRIRSTYGRQ
ncbi:4-hydroxythreonine-4-phosphate dehydrogenase PdxA [Stackebrandtia nassauensis]|uniref:4-hydroxythreonine-4-phosphate dehydrogenase n=1 Tax=Stackebrandtia nassauensis (strain DSM 44728 / CIP 108903 / NRRL B-16338 / NBRC 102104 / LLR-40K-21) TaxID=446470 RepID=D3QBQ2_STANL|nr:4-hydroxythreonine-4-phosphate dehydrogenase PdxA [Stackebrandtia nassauensis]ADD42934.1 4-hydroxythreonine-4-phosphate dehydrogenase [Stackebrandtia nassauensis DSM 44728]